MLFLHSSLQQDFGIIGQAAKLPDLLLKYKIKEVLSKSFGRPEDQSRPWTGPNGFTRQSNGKTQTAPPPSGDSPLAVSAKTGAAAPD
jgi:hypothetical protein